MNRYRPWLMSEVPDRDCLGKGRSWTICQGYASVGSWQEILPVTPRYLCSILPTPLRRDTHCLGGRRPRITRSGHKVSSMGPARAGREARGAAVARVYVSSTFQDLKDHRQAVCEALRQMRHDVIAMEEYVAADQRPVEKCLADVRRSDIYVGILAWRYGYVPADNNPAGLSITELEYREAGEAAKPRLLFLVDDQASWPRRFVDGGEAAERIEQLRASVTRDAIVRFFSTADELATQVAVAVADVTDGNDAETLAPYLTALRAWVNQALPRAPYDVPVGEYVSAEAILSGQEPTRLVDDLSILAQERGAVLIHGPGGSGKSVLLRRMALQRLERGEISVLLDLSLLPNLVPEDEHIAQLDLSELFDRMLLCSPYPLRRTDLSHLGSTILLIVDGLNELSSQAPLESAQARILAAVHAARADHRRLLVMVADRLNPRREADQYGYRRLALRPLATSTVRELVPDFDDLPPRTREILRLPFFLGLWRGRSEGQQVSMSKAAMLSQTLLEGGRLNAEQIAELSETAYRAYEAGSQYFRLDSVSSVADKLISAGFLIRQEASSTVPDGAALAKFSHELFHDYLASSFVASRKAPWTEDTFDALSLRAQSVEAVQLALEQVGPTGREDFLTRVYDWNATAAAVCLAEEQRYSMVEGLTQEARIAIVASIAARQFDIFPHTRSGAARTLRGLPLTLTNGFLVGHETVTETSIRERISSIRSDREWFLRWQEMYVRQPGGEASRHDLRTATDENSLLGWCAANTIRRLSIPETLWHELFGMLAAYDGHIQFRSRRWRLAHILGRSCTHEAKEELLRLLTGDEYHWVRYGAARSLIEVAWRSEGMRAGILSELADLASRLPPLCISELDRALEIGAGNARWRELSHPLADALHTTRAASPAPTTVGGSAATRREQTEDGP
jgi:hypothetical protein